MILLPTEVAVTHRSIAVETAMIGDERTFARFSVATSVTALTIGVLVLVGAVAGIPALSTLGYSVEAMRPSSAMATLCGAAALLLLLRQPVSRPRRLAASGFASGMMLLAFTSGLQHATGLRTRLESVFEFSAPFGQGFAPVTMAPLAVPLYTTMAIALLRFDTLARHRWMAGHFLTGAVAVVLLPLFGYLYGVKSFTDTPARIVPLPGALTAFLLVCAAGLVARPDRGWMKILRSPLTGGMVARRILPGAVLIPFALGWVRLAVWKMGWISAELGTAWLVYAIMLLLIVFLVPTLLLLDRGDAERRSAALYARSLLEASPDPLVTISPEGRITDVNAATERVTGRSREELIGTEFSDYFTDTASARAGYQRVFDEGEVRDYPLTLRSIHGHLTEVLYNASVYRDGMGEVKGVFAAARDVTERNRAQDAALRLAAIVESTADAVIGKTLDGAISSWNRGAENLYGYAAGEVLGRHVGSLAPPDRAGEMQDVIGRIRNGEFIEPFETVRVTKDGRPIAVSLTVSPIYNSSAQLIGISTIARDISERKIAEEQVRKAMADLERSNRDLEQFAYVASHDLQEPLRMVSSYTQLLARRYATKLDQDALDFIGFAVDGANRMQRLINDLLLYSRVGTRGRAVAATDSHAALGGALANLAASIEAAGALVTNDDLPLVTADEGQLAQLFQNLIGNAVKFRRKDVAPRIHVSARADGEQWIFSVRDNGIGIDPEFRSRLFVIFQRLHGRDEYPGTGIGLAICKRIVERHGGRIWFESQPGEGATFFFTVPAAKVKEPAHV